MRAADFLAIAYTMAPDSISWRPSASKTGTIAKGCLCRCTGILGLQDDLDPRQVRRQRAPTRPPLGSTITVPRRVTLLGPGITLGDRRLEILQPELKAALRANARSVASAGRARNPARASRRHANTCCGQTCQRRATSLTEVPGASVSATIRPFSDADHRRRRPGPVSTSTRRKPPFASALTSSIAIARSRHARLPPRSDRQRKNGHAAPLTAQGRH